MAEEYLSFPEPFLAYHGRLPAVDHGVIVGTNGMSLRHGTKIPQEKCKITAKFP